ncbi:MAG: conjugative relaxase [Conexibacter sp.]|nr:conjugative relaxase [Conexibacter sp.]
MLSLGKIAVGPGAARYYTDQVARGRDDYYAGCKEEPGHWVGAGADGLGWEGDVDADVFANLLAGAGLRRAPKDGGVAGLDLTFRAPKSVSVLWAVAADELGDELRAAHDVAVREAFGYLEREACWARRGAGGKVQVRGRGFVGAAFMHRASRAGDPLLHTHVVVGNLTQGPDGRWTALDARHLYRHAKTAGYLYQAALRAEITDRTGLQWSPVQRGVADLAVVSREVVDHFSQRRAEILEHMAEHGGRSAASAQIAALETRRAKDEPPLVRQRAQWQARAAEHGLGPNELADLTAKQPLREPSDARGIDPDLLTAHTSTFGRPELLQALAEAQPGGAHVTDLERLAAATLDAPEIVRLRDGTAAAAVTEPRFSTRELLDTEARVLAIAAERQDRAPVVASATVQRVMKDRATLSDEQRDVVRGLAEGAAGITVLRAAAGTGKTFVLDAAREAWEAEGIPVLGCALSARAARELEDQSAIPGQTIAAVRGRLTVGYELPAGATLVVDEAGMVGTRALADLAEATARVNGRLVLVGDDRQLPEIEAGGAFHALAERPGTLELHEVRRQREPWDRRALDALRRGDVERWARAYRAAGQITIGDTAADTRAALVNDWSRAEGERLMIAARRSDVRDLNDRARQLLRAQAALGPDEITIGDRAFATGDQILTTRNDHRLGVLNGQRGTITAIDSANTRITVALDGDERLLDAPYLDDGHLDHGYAITAHRAQGATVDRTFVLGSDELYREWGYTALSRHRQQARFYVTQSDLGLDQDHAPAPDPLASGLERLLGRSRAQGLARDQLPADLDDDAIDAELSDLTAQLIRDPHPPARLPQLTVARAEAEQDLDATAAGFRKLEAQRETTPLWRRRERAELDRDLAAHRDALQQRQARAAAAATEEQTLRSSTYAWIADHGPTASRYVALTREQQQRAEATHRAHARIDHHDHHPSPWHDAPPLDLPTTAPDLDLGW